MQVHETDGQSELGNPALRVRPRDELHLAFVHARLDADAPQRVEVDLHHVAVAHQGIEMREALAPPRAALALDRRDGIAHAEKPREPRAARMLREMHEQVVAPGAQCAQQPPFFAQT